MCKCSPHVKFFVSVSISIDMVIRTSGALIVGGTIRGTVAKAKLVIAHNILTGKVKSETDIHVSGRAGGTLDAGGFIRANAYTENIKLINGKTLNYKGVKVDKEKLLADFDLTFHPLFGKGVKQNTPFYVRCSDGDGKHYWIGYNRALKAEDNDKPPRRAKAFAELQDAVRLEPFEGSSSFLPEEQKTLEIFCGKRRVFTVRINAEMTEFIQRIARSWLHDSLNQADFHAHRRKSYADAMYNNDGTLHSYDLMRGDLNYVARKLFWDRKGKKCERHISGLIRDYKPKPIEKPKKEVPEKKDVISSFEQAAPEPMPYDFFSEEAVIKEAKSINPRFQSSVLQWGKKLLEHASATYVREQSKILRDYKECLPNVSETLGEIDELASRIQGNARFAFLPRLFSFSANPQSVNFEAMLSALGRLTDGLVVDSDHLLELMERTEKSRDEIYKYGGAIKAHHKILDGVYRSVIDEQTGSVDAPSKGLEPAQDIRQRLKSRCDELELGHKTWSSSHGTMNLILSDVERNNELISTLKAHIAGGVMARVKEGIRQEQRRAEIKLTRLNTQAKKDELAEIEKNIKDIATMVRTEVEGIDSCIASMNDNVLLLSNGKKPLYIEAPKPIALISYYEPDASEQTPSVTQP